MDAFIKLLPKEELRTEVKNKWAKLMNGTDKWRVYKEIVEKNAKEQQ